MPNERENLSKLQGRDYVIAGNVLRAYYDADNKLVFVVDATVDDAIKPNVMLVINTPNNRKWDDVLVNDYNVDLENVRPKKDNKYQKLDIEYGDMAEYDALIKRFVAGENLDDALAALMRFRDAAGRRAAAARLAAAVDTAEKSRETIERADDSIQELQGQIKQLRSKLTQQRKSIGREMTKQSASKILKTESQIDATNEKLKRAKKRRLNAQRRMLAADADAAAAREILGRPEMAGAAASVPAKMAPNEIVAKTPAPVPVVEPDIPQFADIITSDNTKAEDMADNNDKDAVKPLFDKDPEILDEEIAFKPIDFNIPSVPDTPDVAQPQDESAPVGELAPELVAPAPLTFTPPVYDEHETETAVVPREDNAPVLNSIRSVDAPREEELPAGVAPIDLAVQSGPEPVMPPVVDTTPAPVVAPAPISSGLRPVSPVSGPRANAAAGNDDNKSQRPTVLYYVMLVLLIALSVFTLWLYQKNMGGNVPELVNGQDEKAAVQKTVDDVVPGAIADEDPFIGGADNEFTDETVAVETVSVAADPETVASAEVADDAAADEASTEMDDASVAVSEALNAPVDTIDEDLSSVEPQAEVAEDTELETVADSVEPVAEDTDADEVFEDEADEEDMDDAEPAATQEEIVNKPAYNVSAGDDMVVPGPDFETDDAPLCDDGSTPDTNGCCNGEIYTNMEDGSLACCNTETNSCFAPLK